MTTPEKTAGPASQPAFPPGPRGIPVIGNALQMGDRNILASYLEMNRKYGDLVHIKLGPMHGYILFHPEHVNYVLVKNQKNFVKGIGYSGLRLMLGQGLVTSDGEVWRQDRRLMQPYFTYSAVHRFTEMMVDVTQTMLDRWAIKAGVNQPVLMDDEMMRLTMSVIGRALFGVELDEGLAQVGAALREAFEFVPERSANPMALPLSVPLPGHRRFLKAQAVIRSFVQERIQAGKRDTSSDDLLSVLLRAQDQESGYRLSDQQLYDEVVTLFFAGFETTARSLTWGWYLLGQQPAAFERIRAEAQTVLGDRKLEVADLPALKYTRQVVDETLRLYPPTAMLARQNVEADEIGGYPIPPNSFIILVPFVVHRHPSAWQDPDSFNPDRFSESAPPVPKAAYIPFASGPRVCLGNSFALQEMIIAYAMAARRFDAQPASNKEIPFEFAGAIRPQKPLWVKLTKI